MPLGIEVQRDLLAKYGYAPDPMGAMQMLMAIRMVAAADPALSALVMTLQSKIMGGV